MKIIHIAGGGDVGGAKTHIIALCKELTKMGHNLSLVSLRKGDFSDSCREANINTVTLSSKLGISDMLRLGAYIRKEKPDIVHCHGAKANLFGAIAKLFHRKNPFCTTVHSDYRLDYMDSFLRRNTFGRLNTIALRFFDYYVSVSHRFKSMLISRGFKADKIMPIYNGLDFDKKCNEVFDRGEYLRSLGLDFTGKEIVIGLPTRIHPVKDIPTLLRAFAKSLEVNKDLRLLIGGDGEILDQLKEMAQGLGIAPYVSFCGWINDVSKFFAACDIDVLCSISETFPYTILEGIREGCAVISSNVGGVSNMIDSGENGFIFEPGDVDTFSKYILTLAGDEALRKSFAEKLLARAKNLYSIQKMAERQQEIYGQMRELFSRPKRDGVIICGAYGRGNSGDEAILQAIIDSMRSIDPLIPITVMTRKPNETKLLHSVRAVYTFNFWKVFPAMLRAKLFISGGGSLIQNVTSTRSLLFYLFSMFSAKISGCYIHMYGCGIGLVKGAFNLKLAGKIIDKCADMITVRDMASLDELKKMGVTRPETSLSSDPGFSLSKASDNEVEAYFKTHGLDIDGKYICFSLRNWKDFEGFEIYARGAKYAWEKYGLRPVFLPIEVPKDIAPSEYTAKLSGMDCVILKNPEDVPLIMGILGKMTLVCAVRLHALIFAANSGAPFIGTSYDLKVESFMASVDMSENCIVLDKLTEQWLFEAIDRLMCKDERDKYENIPEILREREKINREKSQILLKK